MKKTAFLLAIIISMIFICIGVSAEDIYKLSDITVFETSESYDAKTEVTIKTAVKTTAVCVGAMYKDGALTEKITENISITAGIKKELCFSFPKKEYDEIKIFIFSDLESIEPLCTGVTTEKPVSDYPCFGFVYALYIDQNGVDNIPKAIIYDTDGKFETYEFSDNILTNSAISVSQYSLDYDFSAIGGSNQKMIAYKLDNDEKICEYFYGNGIKDYYGNCESLSSSNGLFYEKTSKLDSSVIEKGFKFISLEDAAYQTTLDKNNFDILEKDFLNENDTYSYEIIRDTKTRNALFGIVFDVRLRALNNGPVMLVSNVGTARKLQR